jgi:ubiquinone/menaquinone biosynthesis C-methylase UbiE
MRQIYLERCLIVISQQVIQKVLESMPMNGYILDAGCGNLAYSTYLKDFNKNIISLDIKFSNTSDSKEINLVTGTIEKLPFKDKSFDFILCLSVIQFIKNDSIVINEFNRVLKVNGKLLFTIPTKRSLFKFMRDLKIELDIYKFSEFNTNYYKYYTRENIINLSRNSFKIMNISGYRYNFIPELVNFILNIIKTKNFTMIAGDIIIKSFNKLKHNQKKDHFDQHKSYTLATIIIKELINFPDLSYHYIVIFQKI